MACVIVLSNKCDITRASLEADQQEPNPCYAVGTSSESPCVSWGRMSSRILLFAHVHVLHDLLLHVCEVCFFIAKKKKKAEIHQYIAALLIFGGSKCLVLAARIHF